MRKLRIMIRNFRRAGRLTPAANGGLRARAVRLGPGGAMEWHTTGDREELLLGVRGRVRVEVDQARRIRRIVLAEGLGVFLPSQVRHRVVNASARPGLYLYVTGPTC